MGCRHDLSECVTLFVLVAVIGSGLPGPGDASLIVAGTLAGEGRLNVWVVLGTAMVAWMPGSVIGYEIGAWKDAGCSTTRDGLRTHA